MPFPSCPQEPLSLLPHSKDMSLPFPAALDVCSKQQSSSCDHCQLLPNQAPRRTASSSAASPARQDYTEAGTASRGTVQAAGGFSGGGNRPQASKPAKNGVSLYLTLGRAGKAFHQAATANQEQSSHEQRRGAGLCLLPGGSDKPPAGWPQALRCPKNELGELWVWVLPALQPALSEGNGSA